MTSRAAEVSGCGRPDCCRTGVTTAPPAGFRRRLRLGYGLPLTGMLLAAGIAHVMIGTDLAVAIAALAGLWSGARLAGHLVALIHPDATLMSNTFHPDFPSPSKERHEHA